MHQFEIHYVYRDEQGFTLREGDATKMATTEEQAIQLFKAEFESRVDETYNPAQLEISVKVTVDPVALATDFKELLHFLDEDGTPLIRASANFLLEKYRLYFAQLGDK